MKLNCHRVQEDCGGVEVTLSEPLPRAARLEFEACAPSLAPITGVRFGTGYRRGSVRCSLTGGAFCELRKRSGLPQLLSLPVQANKLHSWLLTNKAAHKGGLYVGLMCPLKIFSVLLL